MISMICFAVKPPLCYTAPHHDKDDKRYAGLSRAWASNRGRRKAEGRGFASPSTDAGVHSSHFRSAREGVREERRDVDATQGEVEGHFYIWDIPRPTLYRLKMAAAAEEKTVKDLVLELVNGKIQELERKGILPKGK